MKKLLTLLVLSGSLLFVGCKNSLPNAIATSYFDDILGAGKTFDSGAQLCLKWSGERCKHGLDIGTLLIVEEPAIGENRVILKAWSDGIFGLLGAGWHYFGVDFSPEDFDAWEALGDDASKLTALLEILGAGFDKYGYLKFEPADSEFFFKNAEGNWEVFSENVASVKDLELMGSKVEDKNAAALGESLSAQYGLSNERGQVVAKTLAAYNKLTSKRSLTAVEKNQFSNNVLGVDYKTAERSIKGGNADEFQALMEQAARTNGTTPEAVSAIIKDMVL